jgi:polysaccharide export outer membrane protein
MVKATTLLSLFVLAGLGLQPITAAAQGRATESAPASRDAAPAPAKPVAPAPAAAKPAAPAPTRAAAKAAPGSWSGEDYRLGPGDKLRVEVFEQDQLSQSVQVRPDGKITLPFVGDVTAAGQTSVELGQALTASLKEYVINPVVTVIVQEATSAQICIIGEVRTPGCQVMNGPMTVLEALSRAGDVTEFANRSNIRILRRSGTRQERIAFNYKDALKGETEPLFLQPGDQVVVP